MASWRTGSTGYGTMQGHQAVYEHQFSAARDRGWKRNNQNRSRKHVGLRGGTGHHRSRASRCRCRRLCHWPRRHSPRSVASGAAGGSAHALPEPSRDWVRTGGPERPSPAAFLHSSCPAPGAFRNDPAPIERMRRIGRHTSVPRASGILRTRFRGRCRLVRPCPRQARILPPAKLEDIRQIF